MATETSFTKKILRVTFVLGKGSFGAGNTKIINGASGGNHLRVSAEIVKGGQPSKNALKLKIYGMLPDDMNALTRTTINPNQVPKNYVRVEAGDTENGMSLVFEGEISGAWAVYKSPPNLYFHVEAASGFFPSVAPVKPVSVKGGAPVPGLMAMLAKGMGYVFEDNGVSVPLLNNPYLSGTLYNQFASVGEAANIEYGIDNKTLWIAPRGGFRKGQIAVISADTGMKESPVFDKKGLKLETLYNPAITHMGQIYVKSDLVPNATGYWIVNGMWHHLECESPGGKWTTTISAHPVGAPPPTDDPNVDEGGI